MKFTGHERDFNNIVVAAIGPRIKEALENIASGDPATSASLETVFGRSLGEVLGSSEELEEAGLLVERLGASGDDHWQPASRSPGPDPAQLNTQTSH